MAISKEPGVMENAAERLLHKEYVEIEALARQVEVLEKQMRAAAKRLEFEEAARIRDRLKELRRQQIYKA